MGVVLDTSSSPEEHSIASHHPLGISTGVFEDARARWPVLIERARKISTYAVELSALSANELPGLVAYLRGSPALVFRYTSVHAPAKHIREDTVDTLSELPLWVRSIVAHPDVISDFDAYRRLGTRLVLENMDDRKQSGRTPAEMTAVFEELPEAGFCLDVAHVWSIDPSMELAHDLLDRFRARLRHVHLSSLSDGHHVPLRAEDERLFGAVLGRCRDVPWIMEAMPPARWGTRRSL